ncbi:putative indole-3-pyruvate monooxygenase [Helianthus annuus]|uniref:Flavin-containing monooxygenase n=1 Tax=Helianthus annuus TaxID=4232 RepID=A0A251THE1_HELAN|nr:probable indole-3-pyruvate monooxygenase YUCCA10 isoform X2 [Helianthus annuus]KAF5785139.1 putative indole-3-pyruvate monooxygenase [Helianthus annuus]
MTTGVEETVVIIVGAGPSGLATAACLHKLSIPYIILEREDCIASLFNKKTYNRLHLHLVKSFCQLPHLPFPASFPTYAPIAQFLEYLDDYASCFKINPRFCNRVKFAKYEEDEEKWKVEAEVDGGGVKRYEGRFLVVATGETSDVFIPEVDGLSDFKGEVIHSTEYKSGKGYENKKVLVVGAGNSGMEIALDLSNYGAKTSIVVRSPIHILSRWSFNIGLKLQKIIPIHLVDSFLVLVNNIIFGDLTRYGIQRPQEGPIAGKVRHSKYPVVDMGTTEKIKSSEIRVLPALKSANGGGYEVVFENGRFYQFDVILFATGFKRSTHLWLQGGDCLLNNDGLPKPMYPNHWKGENGLYCAGLARRGLYGARMDAQSIAQHIFKLI